MESTINKSTKPLAPPPHPKLVSGTKQACTPKARLGSTLQRDFSCMGPSPSSFLSLPKPEQLMAAAPTQAGTVSARRLGRQESLPQPHLPPKGLGGDADQLGWEGSTLKGRREVLRTGRQNGGERHRREKGFAPSRCVRPSFKAQRSCEGERCEGSRGSTQRAPATALGLRGRLPKKKKPTRNSESRGFHVPEEGHSAQQDQLSAQQLRLQSESPASGPELRVQSLAFTFL